MANENKRRFLCNFAIFEALLVFFWGTFHRTESVLSDRSATAFWADSNQRLIANLDVTEDRLQNRLSIEFFQVSRPSWLDAVFHLCNFQHSPRLSAARAIRHRELFATKLLALIKLICAGKLRPSKGECLED